MNPPVVSSTDLVPQALAGDRRALARLLTRVEDGGPEGQAALAQIYPHTGTAHVVGITGSSGSGKSTLVNCLARELRHRNARLAILAVDPTSPFSGGALLGDRLRMRDLISDPDVFIRSTASRGHLGGVAYATRDMISVLDAVGYPVIIVETVGTGQAQVEVASVAHTVVLVEAPGMGDDIQALKAGLMEVADIIVVNKADRPEAQRTVQALRSVHMQRGPQHTEGANHKTETQVASSGAKTTLNTVWDVPILQTSALERVGISELLDVIAAHREFLIESGQWEIVRERHVRAEVEAWLQRHVQEWLQQGVDSGAMEQAVTAVLHHEQDPVSAAQSLLNSLFEASYKNL